MNNLNMQLKLAGAVPANLPHKSRNEEIEELIQYLIIEGELPAGLSMISVGQNEPDANSRDIPWVQLDEAGAPLGIFQYYDGSWIELAPQKTLTNPVDNAYMQTMNLSLLVQTEADQPAAIINQAITEPFDDGTVPVIIVQKKPSALLTEDPYYAAYPENVSNTKFDLKVVSSADNSVATGTPRTAEFDVILIGVKS